MKIMELWAFLSALLVLGSTRIGHVVDESFAEQFLGSPLLALTAVLVMAAVASLYYKMKK